ncbi:YheC/YheD family protein [Fodinisporobacter ferrooxydans]|uniref:YheC/YheD family protein n=1 Tax=Fodinisporobacter ferrooxydans TaxID=2901836 RepID=A0ABY4CMI2_9BACL|nr:YheC/YheD family protein [Alicyclobacillaceae bacterium MYW30-H2]
MANSAQKRPEMGKWLLWKFFHSDSAIRPFLPPTKRLSLSTCREFLNRYSAVYLKPAGGWGGKGIIRAWRTQSGYAFIREKGQTYHCKSIEDLYQTITPFLANKVYIVQKAIALAKWKGRPYDIRLMMLRNGEGKWQYAGMLAKVAGEKSIITNIARGRGFVLDVDSAFRHSFGWNQEQILRMKQNMTELGYATCKRFDAYKYYWNIGLDLAIDQKGKLWIIEENTGPALFLFAKLKDQKAYQAIRTIIAGRRKNRKKLTDKK